MGTSTNAILFYGYCWDDEDVRNPWEAADDEEALENGNEDEDEDWETRYARAKGCLPPREPYPERTVTPTRANNYDSTPKDWPSIRRGTDCSPSSVKRWASPPKGSGPRGGS